MASSVVTSVGLPLTLEKLISALSMKLIHSVNAENLNQLRQGIRSRVDEELLLIAAQVDRTRKDTARVIALAILYVASAPPFILNIITLLVMLLTLQPLGTSEVHPLFSIGFWAVSMAAMLALAVALWFAVIFVLSYKKLNLTITYSIHSVLESLIASGLLYVLLYASFPHKVFSFQEISFTVFLIGLMIRATLYRDAKEIGIIHPSRWIKRKQVSPLILALPFKYRGKLISISGANHKVQIATVSGICELRMRFSDAMDAVINEDGIQVHRSHWVALDAIQGINKIGNRRMISLQDGRSIPVSKRNYQVIEGVLEKVAPINSSQRV